VTSPALAVETLFCGDGKIQANTAREILESLE